MPKPQEIFVGKVVASKYRLRILSTLERRLLTPSQISDITKINRSHVSRFLKELETDGLVECRTSGLRKGKLYSITNLGDSILRKVRELDGKQSRS